jgi:hypothetical protein
LTIGAIPVTGVAIPHAEHCSYCKLRQLRLSIRGARHRTRMHGFRGGWLEGGDARPIQDAMSMSAISGASQSAPSSRNDKVDLAAVAVAKALRVQRQQAEGMISLIQQATSGDVGRHISVRA